jgi:hypothetical protein
MINAVANPTTNLPRRRRRRRNKGAASRLIGQNITPRSWRCSPASAVVVKDVCTAMVTGVEVVTAVIVAVDGALVQVLVAGTPAHEKVMAPA